MVLKAVKKTRVYEDIVSQFKELIASGTLRPGQQLPSERELSDTFQVSRASVREAIRTLESAGFIEIRSGEGTFIASSVETLLASLTIHQRDPILQVFEARKTVEPAIAALAAERATAEQLTELTAILEDQARQIAEGETGMEADTRFHSTLAEAAGNQVLVRLAEAIVDSLRETRERSLQTKGRPPRSLAGHREILAAIRDRDSDKARVAMLNHLETIEHNVLRPHEDRKREKGVDDAVAPEVTAGNEVVSTQV